MTWLNDIFRSIFFFIDSAIYGVMQTLYNFLLDISKVQIFSESAIQNFATRIYAFLGIFMIFKLTVSMVQYVAEPEKLESDGKKIVINIMVALALMIILPGIVFPLSTRLQDAILDDGVIENLILGIDPTDTAGKTRKQAGRTVSYLSFSTFFYLAPCENVSTFIIQQKDDGTYETVLSAECESEITVPAAGNFIADYAASYEQKNMKMLREWVNEKNNNKEYLFTYNYIISSIVGLVELFIFFRFCFDISLRAVKLGFLQLIAPIPIISYADPKSKKVFDTYIKEYINTYLSLFIRLAAIYFAITIISMIANNQIYQRVDDGIAPVTNFWVQLFIIIGCLMFASEVPKLLEKLLGINVGSMSLNPFKNSPLANAVVGGAIGAVGGGFAGFRAGSQAGAPVRGVLSGIGSGITTGAKTQPGKGVLRQSMDKSYQNLTGNHYEHMSPGRFIMGIGGQKKS